MHSHDDHYKFGYNGALYNGRTSPEDAWWVSYGASQRQALDFRTECKKTAELIRDSTKDKIVVLFSGGVDSEVVMRAFKDAGIPIEAAIVQFNDDCNRHDIDYAFEYCQAYAVKYTVYDLNLHEFWKHEVYQYASLAGSVSPLLCSTMWAIDQIDGYPIVGSGDSFLAKRIPPEHRKEQPYPPTTWDIYDKEVLTSVQRFLRARERDGAPRFLKYTPEVFYAYLMSPVIVDLVNNRRVGRYSNYDVKFESYAYFYQDMRPRPKYTGFEMLQPLSQTIRRNLESAQFGGDAIIKTPYHRMVDHLGYHGDMATAIAPIEFWKREGT